MYLSYGWALGELNFRRKIAIHEDKKNLYPIPWKSCLVDIDSHKGPIEIYMSNLLPTWITPGPLGVFVVIRSHGGKVLGHQRGGQEIDHLQILAGSFGGSNHFEPSPYQNRSVKMCLLLMLEDSLHNSTYKCRFRVEVWPMAIVTNTPVHGKGNL